MRIFLGQLGKGLPDQGQLPTSRTAFPAGFFIAAGAGRPSQTASFWGAGGENRLVLEIALLRRAGTSQKRPRGCHEGDV